MSSFTNKDVFEIEFKCNDGTKVYLMKKDDVKHLPAYSKLIMEKFSEKKDCEGAFVTVVPFPQNPVQFLLDHVALYTNCDTVEDVKGLCMATQDKNLLEIKQVVEVAKWFKCDAFVKALELVISSRGDHFIYLNPGETLRSSTRSSDMSGITFRFADKGEIFVGDRKLITLLPLYQRMIEISCPDWETKSSEFNFFVKVPLTMEIVKTIFDYVKVFVAPPPKDFSQDMVEKFYPESENWNLEELADISEATIFFETKVLEQAISYIVIERMGRFSTDEEVLRKFGKTVYTFNYGYEPSTSGAGSFF